ncbi:hypothetical protein ACTFIR_008583 [Dictyostelium discoideum]
MSSPTKSSGSGRTYWSDDEENYLKEQYFQMKKNEERINHMKLCNLINKKFHSGSPIRTAQAIKNKSHVLGITTPTSTPNSTPTKKEPEKAIPGFLTEVIENIKNVGDINNQDDDDDDDEDDVDEEEESDNGEDEEYYDDQEDYEFEINEDEFNQVKNEKVNEKEKKVLQTTSVSISNMDNRNSVPFQIELQIPSKTKTTSTTKTKTTKTKTTKTTTKRDVILSEMDYLKKRLDYLNEKLKNLDLNRK